MPLSKTTINKMIRKHKDVFEILANYDRTREWPIGRARIDITIDKRILKKLREKSAASGKPISRIIEEAVA
jgi:hypothetical protein